MDLRVAASIITVRQVCMRVPGRCCPARVLSIIACGPSSFDVRRRAAGNPVDFAAIHRRQSHRAPHRHPALPFRPQPHTYPARTAALAPILAIHVVAGCPICPASPYIARAIRRRCPRHSIHLPRGACHGGPRQSREPRREGARIDIHRSLHPSTARGRRASRTSRFATRSRTALTARACVVSG